MPNLHILKFWRNNDQNMLEVRNSAIDAIQVLHVDDDPDFTDLAATFLKDEDARFEIQTTTSPQEGLEHLRNSDVDCIVSDYEMPRQTGISFLETVREDHSDLPFILFTGKGSEEIASEAISAGVTDYMQKQRGTDQYTVLANRIRNAVAKHRAETLIDRAFRAMDRSREGIALLDEAGEFIYVNDAYTGIVGYAQAELIGESWELVYPNEQVERIYDEILAAVPENGHWTGDTVYERKDGTRVRVNHALAYSDEGTMICLIRDRSTDEGHRQELRQERQRFDLFIDAVEDYAIFMLDPDGYVLSWNKGAKRIKGYGEDEILGEHFSVFYPEEQRRKGLPETLLDRAIENGAVEHKGPRVRQNGTTFHADVVITAVDGEDGTHRGFVKVTRDISEQVDRERELEQYRALTQAANDVIVTIDQESTIRSVNPAVTDFFGYAADDLRGESLTTLMPEQHAARHLDAIDRYLETGEKQVDWDYVELPGQRADGTEIPLAVSFSETTVNNERFFTGIIRDISKRKEYEDILEQTTRQLQAVLDTVEAAIFIKDTEGRYQLMNQECRRLLGVDSDVDITGMTDQDLVSADMAEQYRATDKRVMETGNTLEFEEELPAPGGTQINRTLKSPFYDEDGDLAGVCAVSTEITDHIEKEQALQRERDRLDEFASLVSHDLRNPLRVAAGRLELAREESDSAHLDAIETAHDRMNRIIEDALRLAREGRDIGSMEVVQLCEAVDSAWELVADSINRAELQYASEEITELKITADYERLRHLLENLFRNAIEHGGREVAITVGGLPDGFYVEDDGPGIPAEDRYDVFAPSYSTTTKGAGFGLRIVRQIATAHDWEIHVAESSAGGARFEITGVETAE